jgi:hypothetical protein
MRFEREKTHRTKAKREREACRRVEQGSIRFGTERTEVRGVAAPDISMFGCGGLKLNHWRHEWLAARCRGGRGRYHALRNLCSIEPNAFFERLRNCLLLQLLFSPVPDACSGQTVEYALTSRKRLFLFQWMKKGTRHFRRMADLCPEQVESRFLLEVTPCGISRARRFHITLFLLRKVFEQ